MSNIIAYVTAQDFGDTSELDTRESQILSDYDYFLFVRSNGANIDYIETFDYYVEMRLGWYFIEPFESLEDATNFCYELCMNHGVKYKDSLKFNIKDFDFLLVNWKLLDKVFTPQDFAELSVLHETQNVFKHQY